MLSDRDNNGERARDARVAERLADVALSTICIGLLGALVVLYTRRAHHSTDALAVYTLVLGGLLAAYATALFSRWRARRWIALWSCYTLAGAWSVEAILVATDDAPGYALARKLDSLRPEFDPRSGLEIVAALRARGVDAWPAVLPRFFLDTGGLAVGNERVLPLSGIASAATVLCRESDGHVIYTSDEHGFRNPPGALRARPEVLIVGDSFAQGACVHDGLTLVDRLVAIGIPAATIGLGGSGPMTELALLREYLPLVRPRAVLWLYFEGNDLEDLREESTSAPLRAYLRDASHTQHLVRKRAMVQEALRRRVAERKTEFGARVAPRGRGDRAAHGSLNGALAALGLWARLGTLRGRLAFGNPPPPVPVPDELEVVLRSARNYAHAHGARFELVYLPTAGRYRLTRMAEDRMFDRAAVLAIVRNLSIPVIDFHRALDETGEPEAHFAYPGGGHYNARGYALLADWVAAALRSR